MDIKEALLVKPLKEPLTNTTCLSHNQKKLRATDIQEDEIKISINLLYVEGTSAKLRLILRSHKIRSTFYAKNTFRKLLRKHKDRLAADDKSNIVYEIDCSDCKTVYLGESKRSLKSLSDEHKKSVKNCNFEKSEIVN